MDEDGNWGLQEGLFTHVKYALPQTLSGSNNTVAHLVKEPDVWPDTLSMLTYIIHAHTQEKKCNFKISYFSTYQDKDNGKTSVVVGTWNQEEHVEWAKKNTARAYHLQDDGTQTVR